MEKIRCEIADVSHMMLTDILQRIAEKNMNIEFVNNIQEKNLSSVVHELGVDVVMTSFDSAELPNNCNELLNKVDDVAVIGLIDDGRRLCICVDDAGPKEVMELIRVAVQGKQKRQV